MKQRLSFVILMVFFLAGCAGKPEVSWDYNHQIDWPSMTTWSWFQPEGNKGNRILSLMAQRVHAQVSENLAKKGLKQVADQKASMWLSWGFTEKSKLEGSGYNGGFYYGPNSWMMMNWPSERVINSFEVGRLTLTVVDRTTHHVIWHGIASQRLTSDMSPQEQREYITKSVKSLLDKFPPPGNYVSSQ